MLKICLRRALRPAAHKFQPGLRLTPGCWMGTHGRNEPREPLNSPKIAKEFIYRLHPKERTCLLRELQSFESMAIAQETLEPSPPTAAQIRYVLFHNAIPFIGFGFLDNAIMIAAGTHIELSIGVTLGISTMAAYPSVIMAAALDPSSGLYFAVKPTKLQLWGTWFQIWQVLGYVEALASKLGLQVPDLTPKQADMWKTRLSSHMGKAIGVSIGCILGMFPLLFLDDEKEKEKETDAPADDGSNMASRSS